MVFDPENVKGTDQRLHKKYKELIGRALGLPQPAREPEIAESPAGDSRDISKQPGWMRYVVEASETLHDFRTRAGTQATAKLPGIYPEGKS